LKENALETQYPACASPGEVDVAWSNELEIAVTTARLSRSALQIQPMQRQESIESRTIPKVATLQLDRIVYSYAFK